MLIFPAVDLYQGKAVRLFKGDYDKMTVYSDKPWEIALDFKNQGATWMHIVDLEGAKDGTTPNFDTVLKIKQTSGLKIEIGGGIRNIETVDRYINMGADRVILGTAAVKDRDFLFAAAKKYGEKIAVGVDIKDGFVAINGWTEKSELDAFEFCQTLQQIGIKTIICTDISKDGAMQGTNVDLYKQLSKNLKMQIIASGGVSSMDDIKRLKALELYGAIIGKAYYTGAVCVKDAIEVAK